MDVTLIYDRTAEDVEQGTDKGYYRHTDLNRVQTAVAEIRNALIDAGYNNVPASALPAWSENDIPRVSQMTAYIENVRSLVGLLPIPGEPELPRNMNGLNFEGANAIEKFLYLLDDTVQRIYGAWFYCGEVFAGEVDV